jgi:hypothetical protein
MDHGPRTTFGIIAINDQMRTSIHTIVCEHLILCLGYPSWIKPSHFLQSFCKCGCSDVTLFYKRTLGGLLLETNRGITPLLAPRGIRSHSRSRRYFQKKLSWGPFGGETKHCLQYGSRFELIIISDQIIYPVVSSCTTI